MRADGNGGAETLGRLALEGEYWAVAFGPREFRVRDSKGLRYLAQLLASPGQEISALALTGGQSAQPGSIAEVVEAGLTVGGESDYGPSLDAQAKAAYRDRLQELREEIDQAQAFHDPERAARARAEYESIADELSAAVGLHGRDRRGGSPAERARLNVTRAIKATVARLGEHDSALGEHLFRSLSTGRMCEYRPRATDPVSWRVSLGGATAPQPTQASTSAGAGEGRSPEPARTSAPAITVVLADDNLIAREGVQALLRMEEDIEVVAVATDYDELLESAEAHTPRVVVTDIRMPPNMLREGIDAAAEIRRRRPDTGIVVLSQFDDPDYAIALLRDGASGYAYLLKDRVAESDHLVRAVREVAAGGSLLDPKIVSSLVRPMSDAGLTPEEEDLLRQVAEGRSIAAIAHASHTTPAIAADMVEAIFLKLAKEVSAGAEDSLRRLRSLYAALATREDPIPSSG
jgi:DNA-binding NarL/FixJ family response regulator